MSLIPAVSSNSNECCRHVPLLIPIKWCCHQLRTMGSLQDAAGTNTCARVASKICLVVLALIAFIPSLIIAGIGLCFSCTFSKEPAGLPINTKIIASNQKPKMLPPPPLKQNSKPSPINQPVSVRSNNKTKPLPPPPTKPAQTKPPTPAQPPSPPKAKPNLPPVVVKRADITEFEDTDLQFDVPGVAPVEVLASKAIEFFKNPNVASRKSLELFFDGLGPNATDHQIIDELLAGHQGFHVGESHDHVAPKKFFIENMEHLKSNGVKTIFFEGFDFRDQNTIDMFLDGTWDENTPEVARLKNLALGWDANYKIPARWSNWEVIKKAKEHNIGISCMDFQGLNIGAGRLLGMNYIAAKVMARELKKFGPNDKFVGYVGAYHLCQPVTDPNIGCSEIVQCPALLIRDNKKNPTKREVFYEALPSDKCVGKVHINVFAPV